MKINAYVLAADPTWIEASVNSYCDIVDQIIVSYDENARSYTGTTTRAQECLARLKKLPCAPKLRFHGGHYARLDHTPMENETYQRICAIEVAKQGADWVLQIDTDEVLPDAQKLVQVLETTRSQAQSVEWPMRVLFRHLDGTRFLEICEADGRPHFEYPGSIAIRPDAVIEHARLCHGPTDRVVVNDHAGDQIAGAGHTEATRPATTEDDLDSPILERPVIGASQAIIHNSWGRSRRNVHAKVSSWSHNNGWRSHLFFYRRWLPAPLIWKWMRDFHPFASHLWARLRPVDLSALLPAEVREQIETANQR